MARLKKDNEKLMAMVQKLLTEKSERKAGQEMEVYEKLCDNKDKKNKKADERRPDNVKKEKNITKNHAKLPKKVLKYNDDDITVEVRDFTWVTY